LLRTIRRINGILAHHTGQPYEKIEHDTQRDFYLTAEEAREYGLVDEIMRPEALSGRVNRELLAASAR
jgi:ATP-dependent Clp protease protease subunit